MFSFGVLDRHIRAVVESVIATDPTPEDPLRGVLVSSEEAMALADLESDTGLDERLNHAAQALELSPLDTSILALCAAPELNPRYSRIFGYLQDNWERTQASPRLAALLLSADANLSEVLPRFSRDAPLRHKGAIRLLAGNDTLPLAEQQIKLADRLIEFLLGTTIAPQLHTNRLRPYEIPEYDPGRSEVVNKLSTLIEADAQLPVIIAGPDAQAILCAATDRPLVIADIRDLDNPEVIGEARLRHALDGSMLCFDGLSTLDVNERQDVVRALNQRAESTFIVCPNRASTFALGDQTMIVVEVGLPSFAERQRAWSEFSGVKDCTDVAAKFRLSIAQIKEAAAVAQLAAASNNNGAAIRSEDLDLGARHASSSRLGELATRLDPVFTWENIVLPARQLELLTSVSAYLHHRDLVLSEWGYEQTVARNQGLKVLFAGASGTGKTMAAQVLASDLGLELFRIDLATVVSKYIGETEKNLDRIFTAATGSNAILLFDEADALFGKRSEVSDAHDRYANIEVSYLLQKMEQYSGAVILATNFRSNIDDAFARRLDFVIDFPFPDSDDRKKIWQLLLPTEAPLGDDIDIDFLATRFKLSGGAIRNCTLSAAFQAAADGRIIAMRHLIRAVAHEYGKQGRLTLQKDFEHFHKFVRFSDSELQNP